MVGRGQEAYFFSCFSIFIATYLDSSDENVFFFFAEASVSFSGDVGIEEDVAITEVCINDNDVFR